VHVIGHHYYSVYSGFCTVVVQTVSQNDLARGRRQLPAIVRHESRKVRPIVFLYVRQVSSV
jgi:hypothetical protein